MILPILFAMSIKAARVIDGRGHLYRNAAVVVDGAKILFFAAASAQAATEYHITIERTGNALTQGRGWCADSHR